jgi:hypothetical protein
VWVFVRFESNLQSFLIALGEHYLKSHHTADATVKETKLAILSQSKYSLLKNEKDLTETQKIKLEEIKKSFTSENEQLHITINI